MTISDSLEATEKSTNTSNSSSKYKGESKMNSPKRLARIAGFLYLLNAITSGFAFAYVLAKVYVAGNAATTALILVNSGLFRLGVVADLFQGTEWVFLAMALYLLLKHVHQSAAQVMVVLVAVGAAIVCLNEVFQFESVRVATDGTYTAALGAAVLVLWRCSCSKSTTTASSSPRSSSACGWCRWAISPTSQGCSPRGSASRSSWGAPVTSWACWRCSWSLTLTSAKRSTSLSPSRQQSRKSQWSYTCF